MTQTRSQVISKALSAHRTSLSEPEAKLLCREYAIPVPSFELVRSQDEAYEASKRLGFPVVAKVVSPQVVHKTDSGGVVLGIQTPDEVKAAFARIVTDVKERVCEANTEGVLLEHMETAGIEVIVGATHDPQFGKVLLFGMGGVFVEIFRDMKFRLAPITEAEALEMIRGIRSRRLLEGYRGKAGADEDAVARILLAVSKMISENEEIMELDLNPVIVHDRGATAVDARVILSDNPPIHSTSVYPPSSLLKFFKPKSVAVVGSSTTPGKIGHEIVNTLSQYEYKGKIYPINPNAESILGLKTYSSILELPEPVDLAIVAVQSKLAPSIVDECGRKGVKNVVIVAGGFKETGLEQVERQTVEVARRYGIRIVGPNCVGVFDGRTRFDTFFHPHEHMLRPKAGGVSFITQSGTFGVTFLEWAAEHGIGISKFVSYGNRCDVDEGDLIDFFAQDDETSIIGMYLEGVGNGRKLYESARRVTSKKPIAILKGGTTSLGSKAAKSHTGWLAGSSEVAKSAFEQAGMIVANDIEELFGMVKALAMQPLPKGPNIALVTNGAGPCVMAADQIEEYGMTIAPLTEKTVSELRKRLPSFSIVSETTIDLTLSRTEDYQTALRILSEAPEVNIIMPFFVFQGTVLDERRILEVMASLKRHGKSTVCCAGGGPYTKRMSDALESLGFPVYQTAEKAVAAVHALVVQAQNAGLIQPRVAS